MFESTIKGFNLTTIFRILDWCKTKGSSVKDIFKTLFLLPFIEVSDIRNLQLYIAERTTSELKKIAIWTEMNFGNINKTSF